MITGQYDSYDRVTDAINALDNVAIKNFIDMYRMDEKYVAYVMHAVVDTGNKSGVDILLAAGCKIDCKGPLNRSPLMTAILRRDYDMCTYLIALGANVNHVASAKQTPLKTAFVAPCDMRIVNLLKNAGAQKVVS